MSYDIFKTKYPRPIKTLYVIVVFFWECSKFAARRAWDVCKDPKILSDWLDRKENKYKSM